jgi:[ribosomal protein S18]-alanine N-acetyltransferase
VSAAGVTIEPMRRDHLDEVVAVEQRTAQRPWSREAFLAELARGDRHYLVATGPGAPVAGDAAAGTTDGRAAAPALTTVVGFAGAALQAGDAHVMTVAVDLPHRRRGTGIRLVRALLREAASAGAQAATLEVRTTNEPALRLYRHVGFVEEGVRPGYYPDGTDAVIMWCRELAACSRPGQEG